jgi:prepilin-type N-terminal cleavage/methylation domain-containing protein
MPMARRHPVSISVRPAGFTLTELLLVITIIVLIGSLGGGAYLGTHRKLLVEKTARRFLLMARYARIAAIERQQPYELQLDQEKGFLLATTQYNQESGQTEKIIIKNYYCQPVVFEGDVQFEAVKIASSTVEPMDEADQEARIVFRPNGSAESAVVQIGDGKTRYTVAVVASTGRVSLYPGQADKIRNATIDLDMQ